MALVRGWRLASVGVARSVLVKAQSAIKRAQGRNSSQVGRRGGVASLLSKNALERGKGWAQRLAQLVGGFVVFCANTPPLFFGVWATAGVTPPFPCKKFF